MRVVFAILASSLAVLALEPALIIAQESRFIDQPAAVFADSQSPLSSNLPAAFPLTTRAPVADLPSNRSPLGPGQMGLLGSIGISPAGPARYQILRYNEDYSYLHDPSRRTDYLDPLKFIPLNERGDRYLSLGGEVREWFESFHNDTFGLGPHNANGYDTYSLQRYMFHADWHLSPEWRIFVQTISGEEDGRIGGPRPDIDDNEFDIHQAFVDKITKIDDDRSVTWRVGRQEFRYGTGRLIDVREGPNLRLSFDAIRGMSKWNEWTIDGWYAKPVRNNPGVFDDDPNPVISFWGLYGVGPVLDEQALSVDLYYLGFQNLQAQFNGSSGSELRHSVGTRIWGRPSNWEYNLEYVYQFGTYGPGDISAWTAANAARYNFVNYRYQPAAGARFDVASGDQNANSQNLQTFNPMFPSGAYFNLASPFGPMNLIDLHPTLDLHLKENLTLSTDWTFFWRESLHDGVYRLSGSQIVSGQTSSARYVGSSPAVTAVWTPLPHVTFLVSYVHVFPGQFISDTTPGQPIDYVTGWMTYKF